jgi:hypothetical protein
MTVFFTSRWKQMGEGGRGLPIPREKQKKVPKVVVADEESHAVEKPSENSGSDSEKSDITIDISSSKIHRSLPGRIWRTPSRRRMAIAFFSTTFKNLSNPVRSVPSWDLQV